MPRARQASSFSRRRRISALESGGAASELGGWVIGLGARPRALEEGLDEWIEAAIHHGFDIADFNAGAVVLDDLVRVERVAADLAAEGDVLLLAREVGQLLLLLLLVELVETCLEDAHGRVTVPELGALVLAGHHDPAWQVGDAYRRVGRVDALPARTRRTVHVDADVLLLDHHFDVLDLGDDRDRREGRMAPLRGVEWRDADQPVDADLALEVAVRVLPGDLDGRGFDARLFARQQVDHLRLEAGPLGPSQVHAQQHLRPVLGLRAARARMDGHDRILPVLGPRENGLELEGFEPTAQPAEPLLDLRHDAFVASLARHLPEQTSLFRLGGQVLDGGKDALQFLNVALQIAQHPAPDLRKSGTPSPRADSPRHTYANQSPQRV